MIGADFLEKDEWMEGAAAGAMVFGPSCWIADARLTHITVATA